MLRSRTKCPSEVWITMSTNSDRLVFIIFVLFLTANIFEANTAENKQMINICQPRCLYLPNNVIKCWRWMCFRWLFQANPISVCSTRFPHYWSKCPQRQIHLWDFWPLRTHFHVLICQLHIPCMWFLLLVAPQPSC